MKHLSDEGGLDLCYSIMDILKIIVAKRSEVDSMRSSIYIMCSEDESLRRKLSAALKIVPPSEVSGERDM